MTEESQGLLINQVLRNDISGKGITNDLRIAGAYGFCRIEVRICMRAERVVNGSAAHAEITIDLIRGRHCVNHRVGLRQSQSFVVHEEKGFVADDWAAQGTAKIVSYQMV